MNWFRAIVLAFGGYYCGFAFRIMNPIMIPFAVHVYNLEEGSEDFLRFESNSNTYYTVGGFISVCLGGFLFNTFGRVRVLIFLEMISVGLAYPYTIKNIQLFYWLRFTTGIVASINFSMGVMTIKELFPRSIYGTSGLITYLVFTIFGFTTSLIKPIFKTDE